MHELHAVEDIFKQALAQARQKKARRVTQLSLNLGELLGFDEGSIKLYFSELAEGTILEGAEVLVLLRKAKLQCKDCQTTFEKERSNITCPQCSSAAVVVLSGKEFTIESIAVAD